MVCIFKRIFFSLFTIIFCFGIIFFSFSFTYTTATYYATNRNRYVTVNAYVSDIDEYSVVSGKIHAVYISYSYNGNEYNYNLYKIAEKKEFEVGDKLDVKIDSDNPGDQYDNKISLGEILFKLLTLISSLLSGILFIFLVTSDLSFVITYRKRMKIYKDFIISLEKAKRDIDIQYRCKKVLKIVLTLIIFVAKVLFMAFVYFKTYAWLVLCVELVSIVLLLIYTCKSLISEYKNNKTINIVQDTLKIKEVLESDSDGGFSLVKKYCFYRLGDWHADDDCLISFKKKEVEQFKTNTRFHIAINAKNKILRIFDYNEFKYEK